MKRWFVFALTILSVLSLCACMAQEESTSGVMDMNAEAVEAHATGESLEGTFPNSAAQQRPATGHRDGEDGAVRTDRQAEHSGFSTAAVPDVTGQVDSIIGNEAVLILGTLQNGTFTESGGTATYLLPVGMPIGTGDFSSVTSGMVLGLSIDASGVITAVSVLSR